MVTFLAAAFLVVVWLVAKRYTRHKYSVDAHITQVSQAASRVQSIRTH